MEICNFGKGGLKPWNVLEENSNFPILEGLFLILFSGIFFRLHQFFSKSFIVSQFQRPNCDFVNGMEVRNSRKGGLGPSNLVQWEPLFQYWKGYSNIIDTFSNSFFFSKFVNVFCFQRPSCCCLNDMGMCNFGKSGLGPLNIAEGKSHFSILDRLF